MQLYVSYNKVMHFPMQVFKNINKILQYTDLQKQSSGGVL